MIPTEISFYFSLKNNGLGLVSNSGCFLLNTDPNVITYLKQILWWVFLRTIL